jgi:hypothetical protein
MNLDIARPIHVQSLIEVKKIIKSDKTRVHGILSIFDMFAYLEFVILFKIAKKHRFGDTF